MNAGRHLESAAERNPALEFVCARVRCGALSAAPCLIDGRTSKIRRGPCEISLPCCVFRPDREVSYGGAHALRSVVYRADPVPRGFLDSILESGLAEHVGDPRSATGH